MREGVQPNGTVHLFLIQIAAESQTWNVETVPLKSTGTF